MKMQVVVPVLILLGAAVLFSARARAALNAPAPPPQVNASLAPRPARETAVLAGGCFWGQQAVFERIRGVVKTTAGYAGGSAATATYDQVTTETTGHAESVEIVFDPSKITYGELLRVYFSIAHDPTQLNRQDNDIGTSYRSAIFYTSDEQKRIATSYIAQLEAAHVFRKPIVTQVTQLKGFYAGEDYHQDYALKNPGNPYIQICDRPKVELLKKEFPDYYVEYRGQR